MSQFRICSLLVLLLTAPLSGCSEDATSPSTEPEPALPQIASISLSTEHDTISLFNGVKLEATLRDASGDIIQSSRPVEWTSSSPTVATVSGGAVVGLSPGSVTITAEAGGKKASAKLDVLIVAQDFEAADPGVLHTLDAIWPTRWSNGVQEGRVSIVSGSEAFEGGRSMRISYPGGTFGTRAGGAQWPLELPKSYDELFASYRLKFGSGFDFVLGGKLPGLAGGANNTGGHKPTGTDGWSARMMWREGGEAVQYVYHPDQPGIYGEDFGWTADGTPVRFEPDQWYRVVHRVVMNTPGKRDGILQAWIDGKLVLDRRDVRFRDTSSLAIDTFYFSTFFGGGDESWATTKQEYTYFDDFIVSQSPLEALP